MSDRLPYCVPFYDLLILPLAARTVTEKEQTGYLFLLGFCIGACVFAYVVKLVKMPYVSYALAVVMARAEADYLPMNGNTYKRSASNDERKKLIALSQTP